MAAFAALAIGATIVGTAISGIGKIYEGNENKRAQYDAAKQEEAAGTAEFAAAQRDARDKELEGNLLMSRQQAVAAASGGGAGIEAPTVVKVMQKTAARAAYNVSAATYAGLSRRDALYASAAARRKSGDNAFIGGLFGAGGTVAGGVGRLATMSV